MLWSGSRPGRVDVDKVRTAQDVKPSLDILSHCSWA